MNKEFLVSVADVWGYDEDDNLLFTAKTLLDTSIENALSATDVRGGKGNQLLYIYYQGGDMKITLTDTQFNLAFLASTVGSALTTGANVYTEENVTLTTGGAGTVTKTPLAIQGTTIYGWVTLTDGTTERVTFTGSNFTCSGTSGQVVCVRYFATDSAAKQIVVKANMIPGIVRLVMDAQLASSDSSTNVIGKVEIIVPKSSLSGNFTLSLTSDGVSNTPLEARALAFSVNSAGCDAQSVYAYINRVVFNANWYDDVVALGIVGGDFSMAALATRQLVVKAIHSDGSVSTPPVADLTFSSSTVGTATVSSGGLVTGVASGTTTVKATITSKTAIDANVVVTVS